TEASKLPIRSDRAERVAGEYRVVADVVNLVEPIGTAAQDHVRGGAERRRGIWPEKPQEALTVKILVLVIAGQITCIVDAVAKGAVDRGGFVEIRPESVAVAIDEPVRIAGAVHVLPDDLVVVVDSRCESCPIGPCSGIVERGPVAAALDEAVGMI